MNQKKPEKYLDRADVVAELQREQAMRERCYPKWLKAGTLKRDAAERQYRGTRTALRVIDAMTDQEFNELLERAKAKITRQQKLFK